MTPDGEPPRTSKNDLQITELQGGAIRLHKPTPHSLEDEIIIKIRFGQHKTSGKS
jgi:hypothetical protein